MQTLKSNGNIPENILQAIEEYWGFGLPKDYRTFLLKYNGGVPLEKNFYFKNTREESGITEFFGIFKNDIDNLLVKATYTGDRIPESMLSIARAAGGDLILLTVKGKDRNKVYLWDHEMEADTENGETADYSNLTLIADSFTEFVEGLRAEDQDD